ncbi:hypothetical protein [Paenibacillus eucommiae]|uniref:Beta-galactosidase trimerisation domain-containing protein n=1 Tax=Paenibacillus eucommiae TaxID=1355755 RepID=A0ABS4IM64_9BACL|nr:hypothetical protein [Paenibacillus eucommiae]MBP1988659.1 hypothetical protein [Paenibacillus eucommiae]
MSGYAYMLRYALQPGHGEEERIQALIDFCRKARIDDVMFFINPLNLNHGTIEETKPWMDAIARAQVLLEPMGVRTSINPLNSLLHDDVDNTPQEGHNFHKMVDPYGNSSSVVVCPLCPEWRSYITEMYAYYATLHPYSLWVEDDFRFHNHAPLSWGGCFCEEHLREFAKQAGTETMEREAFVQGLLAPGDPHAYRRIWLDTCRQTIIDLAAEIGEAVHRVSPETRIGLMTSDPSTHAAEARDWKGLFEAFDGSQSAIIRPHLPAYGETSGIQYAWNFNAVSRLTAAFIPAHTEMYPELENVPYTSYSKSQTFQKYQVETSLLLGSRGVTLNIIDMVGNGMYPQEQHDRWLNEEKDFLEAVASMDLHVQDQAGVQVLVNETSAYTLQTSKKSSASMEGLYPKETFWSSLLSAYGIANSYAVEWPQRQGVVALSGQVLRNYDEAKIRELFASHCVLLEGDAVYTLYEMGLGSLCGITQASWRQGLSYEKISNGREYTGMQEARMRPYLGLGTCLDIQYEQEAATVISQIYNARGDRVCTGMTVVGERIFILPYPGDGAMQNPIRRAVIQEVLQSFSEQPTLMITSYSSHVAVYDFQSSDRHTIAVVNNSLDEVEAIELSGEGLRGEWLAYSRLEPQGKEVVFSSNIVNSVESVESVDSVDRVKIVKSVSSVDKRFLVEGSIPALSMRVFHRRLDQ